MTKQEAAEFMLNLEESYFKEHPRKKSFKATEFFEWIAGRMHVHHVTEACQALKAKCGYGDSDPEVCCGVLIDALEKASEAVEAKPRKKKSS